MLDQNLAAIRLPATGGKDFSFPEQLGRVVVLYFYPKDSTPGCTNEAQQFRGLHAEFLLSGAVVFGVSRDSLRSHENFKAKHGLPFELISDRAEALCRHFGVIRTKSMYGKQVVGIERSTFLLDQTGAICGEWRGVRVAGHAQAVLEAVRRL